MIIPVDPSSRKVKKPRDCRAPVVALERPLELASLPDSRTPSTRWVNYAESCNRTINAHETYDLMIFGQIK